MKVGSVLLLFGLLTSETHSQTRYFIADTVGLNIDSLTKDATYFITETWYLSKSDTINHTLVFDKDYSKHTMKLEFAQSGICYVEAGWMSCGKYGMDFDLDYKINDNVLSILDPNNSFSETMKGDFLIKQYTAKKMVLVRKK